MEGIGNYIKNKAAEKLTHELNEGGLQAVAAKVLELAKITPVYTLAQREGDESFAQSRQRLNTEAGLIISNHPGYFDSMVILNTITRSDLKIVVSESNYRKFAPKIGEDALIKATNEPNEALGFIRSIKNHIESGGVVLIYPTGGADRAGNNPEQFDFKDGLSVILRKCLNPQDMVYSFYVEPEDITVAAGETLSRHSGVFSALLTNENISANVLKDEVPVRVNERYSNASEWQNVVDQAQKENRNQALAQHFINTVGR